eukprot:10166714-Alexandrium_andersonii.AAC.1
MVCHSAILSKTLGSSHPVGGSPPGNRRKLLEATLPVCRFVQGSGAQAPAALWRSIVISLRRLSLSCSHLFGARNGGQGRKRGRED